MTLHLGTCDRLLLATQSIPYFSRHSRESVCVTYRDASGLNAKIMPYDAGIYSSDLRRSACPNFQPSQEDS